MKQAYEIAGRVVAPAHNGEGPIAIYCAPSEEERRFLVEDLAIDSTSGRGTIHRISSSCSA
jgi:hypothetical protein